MPYPLLLEINTRCWLREISDRIGREITLGNVPESEILAWRQNGFTHVWLMGAWTTGPRSRAQALTNPDLCRIYSEVLPGWSEADVPGSPYAIADYHVPAALGSDAGLREFRSRLQAGGLKLLLDFVPNHLGLDHPWLGVHPEFFVRASGQRADFFRQDTPAGAYWLAHGKDPYFPGWTDTAQLDYRQPAVQEAMSDLLRAVADRCDGVRCDMAMLVLNDIFGRTWAEFPANPEPHPSSEFWSLA